MPAINGDPKIGGSWVAQRLSTQEGAFLASIWISRYEVGPHFGIDGRSGVAQSNTEHGSLALAR
jgi:hypothetical protein